MIPLTCPICGQLMTQEEKRVVCQQNHSFDRARQGYINLLPVQQKHSLNPGDTKEMLAARRQFLDKGYYVAKDGVRMACARNKDILWLVATASRLPLPDASLDGLSALFSLFLPEEYARVLKKGGCAVEITVGSDHLRELKEIIYADVFEQHKHPAPCGDSFDEAECSEHRFSLTLPQEDLQALLMMTPHFWRIRKEHRDRLTQIDTLTLTVHYWLRILIRR